MHEKAMVVTAYFSPPVVVTVAVVESCSELDSASNRVNGQDWS
jgi:hypothetical protein